jgi:hypothetical protein
MLIMLPATKIAFLIYSDASFAARFVSIIHMLKTPNFSTLICFDRFDSKRKYGVKYRLCFPVYWCKGDYHRVGRVLSFSSRRNWVSVPPHLVPGGGAHSLAREGMGESQFRLGDRHCGTLYICVLCGDNPILIVNHLNFCLLHGNTNEL